MFDWFHLGHHHLRFYGNVVVLLCQLLFMFFQGRLLIGLLLSFKLVSQLQRSGRDLPAPILSSVVDDPGLDLVSLILSS